MRYDAFLSYNRAADGKLAPTLQSALHRFAKPWYRMRAIRVFRDKTSLSLTEALWPAIEKALSESKYFIFLASPEAADSKWVQKEVDYWLQKKSAKTLLIVLTGGEIEWSDEQGDFNWSKTTALPTNLKKAFTRVPLYLDLRWAKRKNLSLKYPKFNDAVADVAATLHNKPKDQIVGDDVSQHKKTIRLVWFTIIVLLILTLSFGVSAYLAYKNQKVAEQRYAEALSRKLAVDSISQTQDYELSLLLSLEAVKIRNTTEARRALFKALENFPKMRSYLCCYDKPVFGMTFSENGKRLSTVHKDGKIRHWDIFNKPISKKSITELTAGEQLDDPILGPANDVSKISFSSDGKKIVSISKDYSKVFLWDYSLQHTQIYPTGDDKSEVYSVALSYDGTRIALGFRDGKILLWDVASRDFLDPPLDGHKHGIVWSLSFSPDGRVLASGSGEQAPEIKNHPIILWDLKTKQPLAPPLLGHKQGVTSLAFSPNGNILASGGWDNTVILWDLITKQALGSPLVGQDQEIVRLSFSPDGKTLASGSRDIIILWDIATKQSFGVFKRTPKEGGALAFSPNGKRLASDGYGGPNIIIYEIGLKTWQDLACGIAMRSLNVDEWQQYIGDEQFRATCP